MSLENQSGNPTSVCDGDGTYYYYLIFRLRVVMQIFIKTLTGKTITLDDEAIQDSGIGRHST